MSIGEFINCREKEGCISPSRWASEFRQAGYFSATLSSKDIGNWQAAHQWCIKEIGAEHYSWTGNQFWFEREEHAVIFLLRWS